MEIFGENQIYAYVLGILLTCLALVFSTRYTLSNIKRIWTAGKPEPAIALAEEFVQEDVDGGDQSEMDQDTVDPFEYCGHIQSEVKKAKHRVAERQVQEQMSKDEVQAEREIQRQQLQEIFKLMEQNSDKFGASSMEDVQQQMKLYA